MSESETAGAQEAAGGANEHTHGTLLTEARLLLDAVAARLTPIAAAVEQAEPVEAQVCAECGHDGLAACTSCPICKLMTVVRGERPEVTAKLAEGAIQLIGTLRLLLGDKPDAAQSAPPPSPPTKVQHFDVE